MPLFQKLKPFAVSSFLFLFSACVSTSEKEVIDNNIRQMQMEINKLQERTISQFKQMEHTTKATLTSKNDLQSLQSQLEENSGEIDALKLHMKKIEEIISASSERSNAKIAANEQTILLLQRQVAKLELLVPEPTATHTPNQTPTSKQKNTTHLKTAKDVEKLLKRSYEKGDFKEIVQQATHIMQAPNSTPSMISSALELRGEAKFQLNDYRGAVIDLSNYIEQYPNAEKRARALLLLGDSYVYLKNQSIAMSYYNDCVKNYAKTPEGDACEARTQH